MPEIAVENAVCGACGAEVRPGTTYCYDCGEALAASETEAEDVQVDSKTSANNGAAELPGATTQEKRADAHELAKRTIEERRPLRSAAEIRRRARAFERKPVEIVWEEHETAPGILFIIVTILLVLFALGVVIAVVFIK